MSHEYTPEEVAAAAESNRRQLADLDARRMPSQRSDKAESFALASVWVALAGVGAFFVSFLGGSFILAIVGATGIGASIGLYIIAQLLHIRAALESRPSIRE